MFRESLLDSSPNRHDRKRWPMATAFVFESIVASLIVTVPLLSTGVIPVSAHVPQIARLQAVRVASEPPAERTFGHSGGHPAIANVVTLRSNRDVIHYGRPSNWGDDPTADPTIPYVPGDPGPNITICADCQPIAPHVPEKPRPISRFMEALLVHRVEPVYPKTAILINLQGEVRLHAIIARDGTIQSLSVTNGHPMLAQAALDAVRQWRYRPYVLNGQAVEVETFITVNFRRDQ